MFCEQQRRTHTHTSTSQIIHIFKKNSRGHIFILLYANLLAAHNYQVNFQNHQNKYSIEIYGNIDSFLTSSIGNWFRAFHYNGDAFHMT